MSNYKMPPREQNSNKGTFGKVLNICGSKNYIGAAYLSTISSLKVGAGFSALASTKDVIQAVPILLPEAVYYERKEILTKLSSFTTILIGCGLGLEPSSIKFFRQIINRLQKETMPTVIDADGLNILAKLYHENNKEILNFAQNNDKKLIITPHPLEAARLLDCSLQDILENLDVAAQKLCKKYNCITVLKTHRTIICSENRIFLNSNGNSALAKAGSGDVLAGIIAGLAAQKMDLFEASKLGVYLHARAGEIASEKLSEYSVLASDLIKYIGEAISQIQSC